MKLRCVKDMKKVMNALSEWDGIVDADVVHEPKERIKTVTAFLLFALYCME